MLCAGGSAEERLLLHGWGVPGQGWIWLWREGWVSMIEVDMAVEGRMGKYDRGGYGFEGQDG